jgi:biopolymer transport protein ExbD
MKYWALFYTCVIAWFIRCGHGHHKDSTDITEKKLTCLLLGYDSAIYYTGSSQQMRDINRGKITDSVFVKAMFGKIKGGGLSMTLKPGDGAEVMGNLQDMISLSNSYGITNRSVDSTDANEEKALGVVTAPPIREMMQGRPPFKPNLTLPREETDGPKALSNFPTASQLVILFNEDDIYAYMGRDIRKGKKYTRQELTRLLNAKSPDKNFSVAIKPSKSSTYRNTVDMLDMMTTANVKHYALVDITKEEEDYLQVRQD